MFKSGDFVAEHISPRGGGELRDNQIQPNGVDLTVQEIYEPKGRAVINDKSKELPDRLNVKTKKPRDIHTEEGDYPFESNCHYFTLYPNSYIVEYGEKIHIPDDCVGLVLPRSTVMRSNGMVNTALWDSGYKGIGEGRIEVNDKTYLQRYARVAQIVFADAEAYGEYDGQYQNERL